MRRTRCRGIAMMYVLWLSGLLILLAAVGLPLNRAGSAALDAHREFAQAQALADSLLEEVAARVARGEAPAERDEFKGKGVPEAVAAVRLITQAPDQPLGLPAYTVRIISRVPARAGPAARAPRYSAIQVDALVGRSRSGRWEIREYHARQAAGGITAVEAPR